MNEYGEILTRLGRIEGRLDGIEKLNERVGNLEMWQSWLKGAWAALVTAWTLPLQAGDRKVNEQHQRR